LFKCGFEGIMQCVFCDVEIAEQPDERGENPARFRPVNLVQVITNISRAAVSHKPPSSQAALLPLWIWAYL
jgi:hypothetical protein